MLPVQVADATAPAAQPTAGDRVGIPGAPPSTARARSVRMDQVAAETPAVASPDAPLVLVVEDDPVSAHIARSLLGRMGYRTDHASTGPAALVRLLDGGIDLALMDCHLPDLDGLQVTSRYRAWEAGHGRAHLPIVALSADAFAETSAACLAAGMDDHLAKPYHAAELAAKLELWLPRAGDLPSGDLPSGDGVPPMPAAPVVPPLLAQCLADGDRAMAGELGRLYLSTMTDNLAALDAAAADARWADAGEIGHRMKGAAAQVGDEALAAAAAELQDAGAGDDARRASRAAGAVLRAAASSGQVVRAWLDREGLAAEDPAPPA
jgi:CheY-like chemotaxis protein